MLLPTHQEEDGEQNPGLSKTIISNNYFFCIQVRNWPPRRHVHQLQAGNTKNVEDVENAQSESENPEHADKLQAGNSKNGEYVVENSQSKSENPGHADKLQLKAVNTRRNAEDKQVNTYIITLDLLHQSSCRPCQLFVVYYFDNFLQNDV